MKNKIIDELAKDIHKDPQYAKLALEKIYKLGYETAKKRYTAPKAVYAEYLKLTS